ncbi:MAG: outer membrane protein assembly factor BamA [Balneolaceae bacterium]
MTKIKHLCFFITLLFIGLSSQQLFAQDSSQIEIEDPTSVFPRQFEIVDISVTGLVTARENYLISSSGLSVGNSISIPGEDIANAIKQIYRTGLFSDVQINHERVSGGVSIEISVQEEPRLQRFEIEGVKRSHRRDLRDELNLLSGFAVTSSVRNQAVSTIERYYEDEGYWGTEVEIIEELSDDDRNRVALTFDINPGDRTKVRVIEFNGNEEFSDRKLRKEFGEIKQDRWWKIFKRHVYTEEEFELGMNNVTQFYRDNGFRDMRFVEDSVYVDNWRRDKDGVFFEFDIEEGPQYKVRNITWDGNTVYTDDELTETLNFVEGDVFNETRFDANLNINQAESDVTSLYHNIGYLFFQPMPEIQIVGEDSLDIHIEVIEDEIATIRDVSFSGNTKTHDDVVRRNIRSIPGSNYNRSAIIRTVRELGQLGYFTPEGITPDVVPNREDRTVDVSYGLDESQGSDNFEFSGGFGGRQIGVILAARVNFNNFSVQRMFEPGGWDPIPSGDGQRLSLGLQVTGTGYRSYNFSFEEPWLRGRPTSLGVSLSYDFLNFDQNRQQYGGFGGFGGNQSGRTNELFSATASIGRRLSWPDDYFSSRTALKYNKFNVAGFAQFFDDGEADILSIEQTLERNSTDNPISPSTGSKFSISAESAIPLPSFAQFYKLKSSYQHHATIVGKLVMSSTAEFGYMGYFGESNRSNFQRFYLGGTALQQRQSFVNDNIDMRGYPGGFGGVISPVDENRNQIGGRAYNKYSFELRYPAVSSEQIQLIPYTFVDAGNTFRDFASFDAFNVKRSAGVGARIFLPILGLVDLSYGYRFDGTDPSSESSTGLQPGEWEFLFNIGAPF